MSWRSLKSFKYNRNEAKEEAQHWADSFWNEEMEIIYSDDHMATWSYDYWYFTGDGYAANMEEYHTIKALTLLRLLNIIGAKAPLKDRGW